MGSSTAAFAVSTSHTTWPSVTVSPGLTYHLRISASVSPSPTPGILNSRKRCGAATVVTTLSSKRQCAVDCVEYAVQAGQVLLLDPGRGVRRMEAADPQHGCLQVVEAPLGDPGRDLRAGAQLHRGLVHDDQAAGLLDRGLDRVEVHRRQGPEVHHLKATALLG